MKIMIYVGHPAQYLFFRNSIKQLMLNHHEVILLLKTKDVLEQIVNADGFNYFNIMPKVRGKSKFKIAFSLIKRNLRILPLVLKERPDLLIGGDPSISQIGWFLGINRFTLTEDDYEIIKSLANITFPFAQIILSPSVCKSGKWEYKKIGYNGYMKLAYLHPEIFKPNKSLLQKYHIQDKYALIRLAQLNAHHDFGIRGLRIEDVKDIISLIESNGLKVLISSEGVLNDSLISYQLNIEPSDIHHILAFASLLVSDSQSMSVEASILGTPSVRYSDFAGRISVLEELEHKYNLTYGIVPENSNELIKKINEILKVIKINTNFYKTNRDAMLNDKINVSKFTTWFIENYPASARIMKENPDYQHNFK